MKISIFYKIALVFIFVGLCIKAPSLYFEVDYLFQVGLGFSGIGIIFLGIVIIKNRRKNIKSASKEDCLLCLNPTWTWYEILEKCCGVTPIDQTITRLCTNHQPNFVQQMRDLKKKQIDECP